MLFVQVKVSHSGVSVKFPASFIITASLAYIGHFDDELTVISIKNFAVILVITHTMYNTLLQFVNNFLMLVIDSQGRVGTRTVLGGPVPSF